MKIYVINLDRRPDRLRFMQSQMDQIGLTFKRITAVDGLGDEEIGFPPEHPRLSKPEFACYLSHIICFEKVANSEEEHALILEDDAILSPDLCEILESRKLFTHKFGVTRLEGQRNHVWVKRNPVRVDGDFRVLESRTYNGGTGAYVLSRSFAQEILENHRYPKIPFDDLLYHLRVNLCGECRIMQVTPAPAIQLLLHNARGKNFVRESDIHEARVEKGKSLPPKKERKVTWFSRSVNSIIKMYKTSTRKRVRIPFDRESFL